MKPIKKYKLNEEQKKVLGDVMRRLASKEEPLYLYIGGAAGTGKSVLVEKIRQKVTKLYKKKNACVVPIGVDSDDFEEFFTINPLFRIKERKDSPRDTSMPPVKKPRYEGEVNGTKVIIVDNINLVDPTLLAKMDQRLQELTGNQTVFGGLSVIVVGDLLQLKTPGNRFVFEDISRNHQVHRERETPNSPNQLWKMFKFTELTTNMRQSTSIRAYEIVLESQVLQDIRTNNISNTVISFLMKRCIYALKSENLKLDLIFEKFQVMKNNFPSQNYMILAPTNAQVDELNNYKLQKLGGIKQWEPIPSEGTNDEDSTEFQFGEREVIRLALGCQVIITRNTANCYNGDCGKVVGMRNNTIFVKIQGRKEKQVVTRVGWKKTSENGTEFWSQFPIRLSFAMTIHRAQGMTFDGVLLITEGIFGEGAFYSALSRARCLAVCRITHFNYKSWTVSESAIKELERLRALPPVEKEE